MSLQSRGKNLCFCSSVPCSSSTGVTSVFCTSTMTLTLMSTFAISSINRIVLKNVAAAPPYCSETLAPINWPCTHITNTCTYCLLNWIQMFLALDGQITSYLSKWTNYTASKSGKNRMHLQLSHYGVEKVDWKLVHFKTTAIGGK